MALGASAVCIGRPQVWGLAAFGQPGVEAVLDILRRELTTIMRQTGTLSLSQISRHAVIERPSDLALWRTERFVDELDAVRKALHLRCATTTAAMDSVS